MDSKERFGARANDYARARPTYAAEVVSAILDGFDHPVVADVGAGTGISSLLLADAGADVFAVEPNANMLGRMANHPRVRRIEGGADFTTLDEASVDIVSAFQAYHWFDPSTFFPEMNRIVKPRARFAAVWNHKDREDPFTHRFEEVVDRYDLSDGGIDQDRRKGVDEHDLARFGWGNIRLVEAAHRKTFDWDLLAAYLRSVSYLPQSGDAYDAMVRDFRALFDDASKNGVVALSYRCKAQLADR